MEPDSNAAGVARAQVRGVAEFGAGPVARISVVGHRHQDLMKYPQRHSLSS